MKVQWTTLKYRGKTFQEYQVSSNGEIRRNNKLLRLILMGNRYKRKFVNLSSNGIYTICKIHQAVIESFVGERPKDMEVNHINGNKLDNRLINLEYCSHKENIAHAVRTGLLNNKGTKNYFAKLTENQVKEIRDLAKDGIYQRHIALIYGISRPNVSMIVNGKSWLHIA